MLFRGGNAPRLALLVSALALMAGCGTGSGFAGPPRGTFTNASLQGRYAFSLAGNNFSGFFAMAGSFQADGNGNITSGLMDVSTSSAGARTNLAFIGTYRIAPDGRGLATLTSALNPIGLDFVLLSTQHGLLIRFDNNGTGSGALDLQDSSAFSNAALSGGFAFSFSGADSSGHPSAMDGAFSGDASGAITSGVADFNDFGSVTTNVSLGGSYSIGSNGRGTATFTTPGSTLTFAFYPVDANHLKFVETDSGSSLAGDAFRQSGTLNNAALSGVNAFILGGISNGASFVAGGLMTADGNGTITGGIEDINSGAGVFQNVALSGNYSIAANGRGTLTLASSSQTANFAIYPSSGGLQMMEIDSSGVTGGAALPQQGSSFSNSSIQGKFGLNLTGANFLGEVDSIAQFTASNGGFNGAIDFNNAGSLQQNLALGGNYSIAGNGRGTGTLNNASGPINMTFYVVNSSQVLFIEIDPSVASVGVFEQQQ